MTKKEAINEETFKEIFESLSNSFIEQANIEVDVDAIPKEGFDPEVFWFKNIYENNYKSVEAIRMLIAKSTNHLFAGILVNYSDLLWVISDIFKKNIGYICSTDKAHMVLEYCLKRSLDPNCNHNFNKGRVLVNGNLWFNFVKAHPYIRPSAGREFTQAGKALFEALDAAIPRMGSHKMEVMMELLESHPCLKVEIGPAKNSHSLTKLFNQDPENAFDWAKHAYPELVLKIKKLMRYRDRQKSK